MQININKVVSMHYTLKDVSGNAIESSVGKQPLAFIYGIGQIIPGLEEALAGKSKGEQLKVTIPPEKAYGNRNPELVQTVSRGQFPADITIDQGMQFQADNGMIFTVVSVTGDQILLDGNHALAGQTLNFEVEVLEVRDATPEELDHGHVHGPGGHQH